MVLAPICVIRIWGWFPRRRASSRSLCRCTTHELPPTDALRTRPRRSSCFSSPRARCSCKRLVRERVAKRKRRRREKTSDGGAAARRPTSSSMGQQASHARSAHVDELLRLRPLPPSYTALCDPVKGGEAAGGAVAASTEETKDALAKILEFGRALQRLPQGAFSVFLRRPNTRVVALTIGSVRA